MKKKRIDLILVERSLVESRTKAQAIILGGNVSVSGEKIYKPALLFEPDVSITIKKDDFVSRGGKKLSSALDYFGISVTGLVCLDVGASTGGFTDCLLKRGAKKVYAVDVGYGLISESLRKDPRVIVIERKNARFLSRRDILEQVHIATIDCSFISLKLILNPVMGIVLQGGIVLPLVKPQFEVGKGEVEKGGVVRNPEKRIKVVNEISYFAVSIGFSVHGVFECPVKGPKGNVEYFLYLKK